MLNVEGISKTYKSEGLFLFNKKYEAFNALSDISFKLNGGDCLGVLGSNGSGKTTLLKILFGSIFPTKGKISYNNEIVSPDTGLRMHSSLFHNNDRSFFWRLTVRDNLRYFRGLEKEKESKIWLNENPLLNIDSLLDIKFMYLSAGQRKKVALYRGLLKNPDILFFDEFTESLDLENQINFEKLVKHLTKNMNKTVVWVTHSLEEVKNLCNKVLILSNGKIKMIDNNFLNNVEKIDGIKKKLLEQ